MILTWVNGPSFEPVRFESLRRHRRPNDHLVAPDGLCPSPPDRTAPVVDATPEALRDRFAALMEALPNVERVARSADGLQVDWVVRSRLCRFPDSVTARFLATSDGRATLALWSRAHVGISDRGVNRRRAEALLSDL